jgi:galactose-1-phosphate uridylyltransferase
MSTLMDVEIAQKIQKKEGIFRLHEDEWCTVMVPSAPAHDRELWIMPTQYRASFATMDAKERKNYSEILALLLSHLKNEFAHDEYQLSLHTALSDTKQASTWWIQLHKADPGVESPIAIKPLPEVFMRQLKRSLE